MSSASGNFKYDEFFGNYSLNDLVNECHKELSRVYNWKYFKLIPGQFGYDNMVESIGNVFKNIQSHNLKKIDLSEEMIASWVHDGWTNNYVYWRDHKPFETNPSVYFKPAKPLGDERRDLCANTKYQDLPQDEKDKDLIIAKKLLNLMT